MGEISQTILLSRSQKQEQANVLYGDKSMDSMLPWGQDIVTGGGMGEEFLEASNVSWTGCCLQGCVHYENSLSSTFMFGTLLLSWKVYETKEYIRGNSCILHIFIKSGSMYFLFSFYLLMILPERTFFPFKYHLPFLSWLVGLLLPFFIFFLFLFLLFYKQLFC